MPNKLFDHESHLRMLDNAAQFLRLHDADGLAGAVERAKMIHIEMMSRHASTGRIRQDILKLRDKADMAVRDLDDYVLRASGPWIGCDLWLKPGETHGDYVSGATCVAGEPPGTVPGTEH